MLFHASKIVSALILLYTSECLAMPNSDRSNTEEYERVGINFQSAICGAKTYSDMEVFVAYLKGLRYMNSLVQVGLPINLMKYYPSTAELETFSETPYETALNAPKPNQPQDYVVFLLNERKVAKVVTQHGTGIATRYVDCVLTPRVVQSPERKLIEQDHRSNTEEYNKVGINFQSAICGARTYSDNDVFIAYMKGLRGMESFKQKGLPIGLMKYHPSPAELRTFSETPYIAALNEPKPNQPRDLVVYLLNERKVAKVVTQHRNGPITRCVLTPRVVQSPERRPIEQDPAGSSSQRERQQRVKERRRHGRKKPYEASRHDALSRTDKD